MDFLVERPPREVLNRAGVYMWRRGFGMPPGGHTDTSMVFTRTQEQRKGFLGKLVSAFATAHIPVQRVRVVVSEAGERRTRLTIIKSSQGEEPDEWAEIEAELEQWIFEELGGTYWPL
jgi:hypothetical protein